MGLYTWCAVDNAKNVMSDAVSYEIVSSSGTSSQCGLITVTSPKGGEVWQHNTTDNHILKGTKVIQHQAIV